MIRILLIASAFFLISIGCTDFDSGLSTGDTSRGTDTATAFVGGTDTQDLDSDGKPDTEIVIIEDTEDTKDTGDSGDTGDDTNGTDSNDSDSGEDTGSADTGSADIGVDSDTDTSYSEPIAKQTALWDGEIDCNENDMTWECADNAPQPCVPDEPKILCDLTMYDGQGILLYDGLVGIERRGRSSINYYKPNYSIELRMSDGVSENAVPMMGMGKESDWVLDGSWMDRSFMRNDLVFDIYRDLGGRRYGPENRFGTLQFNGEHRGIYRLVEKIKKDDDRVDILDDNGTGSSFVIKQDEDGNIYDHFGMEYNQWQLVYPHRDRADSTQRAGIQSWMDQFSDAMNENRAFDLLDFEATVDYVIVQELAKNIDGFKLSIYLYKDLTGPAYPVPWDIDLAFGQPTLTNDWQDWQNERSDGWISDRTEFIDDIMDAPGFQAAVASRWHELREGPLSNAWVLQRIDDMRAVLNDSAINANFAEFPIEDVDFAHLWDAYTCYDVYSYDDEMNHFRQFITERLTWIDANI